MAEIVQRWRHNNCCHTLLLQALFYLIVYRLAVLCNELNSSAQNDRRLVHNVADVLLDLIANIVR